jgi:hypothetical protein
MCSTAVGTRSGISGLPEPEPELSGTRNVGFHFVRANFGFHFSKPEFPKTRITRPEIFGLPDCPALAACPPEIINLDGPDLPGNDSAIFKVVLERLLSDPEESGGRGVRVCRTRGCDHGWSGGAH